MAKKPTPAEEIYGTEPTEEDVLAGLDEVDDSDTAELVNSLSSNSNHSSDDEAAFLAALDKDIDPAELARRESSLYYPKGLYYFKDNPKGTYRFLSNDRRAKDLDPTKGRLIWNISGVIVHSETKREEQGFQLALSPDERTFASGARQGKPDGFTQTYTMLASFYRKQAMKDVPKPGELWKLLLSGNYAFYLTQSQSGNFIRRFQEKR